MNFYLWRGSELYLEGCSFFKFLIDPFILLFFFYNLEISLAWVSYLLQLLFIFVFTIFKCNSEWFVFMLRHIYLVNKRRVERQEIIQKRLLVLIKYYETHIHSIIASSLHFSWDKLLLLRKYHFNLLFVFPFALYITEQIISLLKHLNSA